MNERNFLFYALVGVAIYFVGRILDISSSRNFSSYNGNMREANPLFRLPSGDCDTRKNLIWSVVFGVVLVVLAFVLPTEYKLSVLILGAILGAFSAVFALRNYSAKKKFGLKRASDPDPVFEPTVDPTVTVYPTDAFVDPSEATTDPDLKTGL